MTIDELKARKRELMARKKYELELQERGEGDNFALFMVNEELLDVNAQLRAIVPAGKGVHFGRKGRASSSLDAYAQNSGDRQQFIKWARAVSGRSFFCTPMGLRRQPSVLSWAYINPPSAGR